jgi:hypothetical protein
MSETGKLVATLVAALVGYSRLAGTDEDRTLARLGGLAPPRPSGGREPRFALRRRMPREASEASCARLEPRAPGLRAGGDPLIVRLKRG